MKEFFKFTLASLLGTFLAIIFTIFAFVIMIVILVSVIQIDETKTISSNTILEIKLDYPVPERTLENPLANFSFGSFELNTPLGLNGILENIKKAKDDDEIEGIYLDLNNFSAGGIATIEAIRNELISFKESGKFIIAYGADISQKAYFLASAADKIYLSPEGNLDFKGLGVELLFFKNTLDKLDVEAQIFQHGKFKSATEPFRLEKMSEENRAQTSALINSVYNNMLKKISMSRGIEVKELDKIASGLLIQNPDDALKYKFIDSLVYEDQVIDYLKDETGINKEKSLNKISISDYADVKSSGSSSKNRIAVIYAVGDIYPVEGDDNIIGIDNITGAIRTARMDKNVKAIVMRVNSPGGDALTSDLIWREVLLAKKEKPFIVSMGEVAASGGYYISCAADTIVAEPNTITGSIGVFGIIPNMKKFFNNKLGITFDGVKTGRYSDILTNTRPLTADEKVIIQKDVDRIYSSFIRKVARGRDMKIEKVDEIAQGHVWSGMQAKEIGLVDEIGGLNDAIIIASKKANLKDYVVVEYPRLKKLIEAVFEDFSTEAEAAYLKHKLGVNYKYYTYLEQIQNIIGMQARMPFKMEIY